MPSINNNREIFAELVFELENFSEDDIVSCLRERTGGDIMIDPRQTIGDYLNELVDLGYLYINGGMYHTRGVHGINHEMC